MLGQLWSSGTAVHVNIVKGLRSCPWLAGAVNGNANGGTGSGASAYVVDTLLQVVPGAAAGACA